MQHETNNVEKRNMESVSVAIPAVVRAGVDGKFILVIHRNHYYIIVYVILYRNIAHTILIWNCLNEVG